MHMTLDSDNTLTVSGSIIYQVINLRQKSRYVLALYLGKYSIISFTKHYWLLHSETLLKQTLINSYKIIWSLENATTNCIYLVILL